MNPLPPCAYIDIGTVPLRLRRRGTGKATWNYGPRVRISPRARILPLGDDVTLIRREQ